MNQKIQHKCKLGILYYVFFATVFLATTFGSASADSFNSENAKVTDEERFCSDLANVAADTVDTRNRGIDKDVVLSRVRQHLRLHHVDETTYKMATIVVKDAYRIKGLPTKSNKKLNDIKNRYEVAVKKSCLKNTPDK